jgi:hypothetical protein
MYVKVTNGTPEIYTIGQLRRDNPNTSFPKSISEGTLASYDVFPLSPTEQPSHDYTKSVVEGTPVQVNGVWTQVWSVSDASSEEIEVINDKMASTNRSRREAKLGETDFYALSDVTMSAEMTVYRQALRDITSHANWPYLEEADWPTKP